MARPRIDGWAPGPVGPHVRIGNGQGKTIVWFPLVVGPEKAMVCSQDNLRRQQDAATAMAVAVQAYDSVRFRADSIVTNTIPMQRGRGRLHSGFGIRGSVRGGVIGARHRYWK